MESDAFTVLVVCTGNLNRSARGSALLARWAEWDLPASLVSEVRVTSAGLSAPVGQPMRTRTRVIAESLGAGGSGHRATQLTPEAVRSADLVLVASRDQVDKVLGLVPAALRTTFTIREAGRIAEMIPAASAPTSVEDLRARVAELAQHRVAPTGGIGADDIVDPQGKDEVAYVTMARQEVPALARIAEVFLAMPRGEVTAYDAAVEAGAYEFGGDGSTLADPPDRTPGRREA